MLNNKFSDLSEYFPKLFQWIKSSLDNSSLKGENLKLMLIDSSKVWGSKTRQTRLSYKIEIKETFYYDFLIDAVKINSDDNLLMLSGKYRYQKEYKPLVEEIYDKASWLKIVKRIMDIEKEKKEIIDF